jgi:alpha-mannosidase
LAVSAELALSTTTAKFDQGLLGKDLDSYQVFNNNFMGEVDEQTINYRIDDLENAPKYDETLTVHLVHHSHTENSWLKTKDEYYFGENSEVQDTKSVRKILDSTIDALLQDENRKFTYSNLSYMQRWWAEQNSDMKEKVRDLVQLGRLELVNGGYVNFDEATTTYEDMLVNLMKGSIFVTKEFDVYPKVGWQLDSYGHSNTAARLFADMGMDALFISRGDSDDKDNRLQKKEMEFVWRPSW